jgi:hydroxypyruvate isomerase
MIAVQFAASISMLFTERPFLDRPAAAAAAGFAAVECHYPYDTPPGDLRRAVERAGLRLLGINTAVRRLGPDDSGIGAFPDLQAEADARFDEAIAYALSAGASAIHVKPGQGDPTDDAARSAFVGHLARSAAKAARHGIMLLIEPLNSRDNPGYFLRGIEQAAGIARDVGHPAVLLMFDVYHVQILEGDVIRRFERLRPLVGHVQIAGVPDRTEPDTGEIAYERLIPRLAALGYDGWIAAEYRPRARTEDGLGWLARLSMPSTDAGGPIP